MALAWSMWTRLILLIRKCNWQAQRRKSGRSRPQNTDCPCWVWQVLGGGGTVLRQLLRPHPQPPPPLHSERETPPLQPAAGRGEWGERESLAYLQEGSYTNTFNYLTDRLYFMLHVPGIFSGISGALSLHGGPPALS